MVSVNVKHHVYFANYFITVDYKTDVCFLCNYMSYCHIIIKIWLTFTDLETRCCNIWFKQNFF